MHKKLTIHLAAAAILLLSTAGGARAQCTGCAAASFGPGVRQFGVGEFAANSTIADFDQDGSPDLAMAAYYNHGVHVFYGDGRGGLSAPVLFPLDDNVGPYVVASGDLDRDGFPDLVVSDYSSPNLRILLSNGAGGFRPQQIYEILPYGARTILPTDLNADGALDLVFGPNSGVHISVLMGDGDGTFSAAPGYDAQSGVGGLTTADFNGDGHGDLALADQNNVDIAFGNGDGGFTAGDPLVLPSNVGSISAGDLNGDDDADLVVTRESLLGAEVFLGDGTGHFAGGPVLPVSRPPGSVQVEDLGGDGAPDVLVNDDQAVIVFDGDGSGTFGPGKTLDVGIGWSVWGSAFGDLNRDGVLDIALGANVLVSRGTTDYDVAPRYPVEEGPAAIASGDYDDDGNTDLAVANTSGTVSVLPGAGDGTFAPAIQTPIAGTPAALATGSFGGDAASDLAIVNGEKVAILIGSAGGGFAPPVYLDGPLNPNGVAVGDFDEDLLEDLVVTGSEVVLMTGDGSGGFSLPVLLPGPVFGFDPVVADFNDDTHADVAIATGGGVTVFLGAGDGTFSAGVSSPVEYGRWLAAADFNGDDKQDLVVGSSYATRASVILGDGAGGFGAPVVIFYGFTPWDSVAVATADFNADGKQDVAVATVGETSAAVILGDGLGGFLPPARWLIGYYASALEVADFDGNGRPDIAVTDSYFTVRHDVAILLNTNCEPRRLGVASDVSTCAPAGAVFPDQPAVGVYDDGGNVVTCDTGVVSAAIVPGTGTAGAALEGDTTVAAAAGIAAFSDLEIDLPGTHYQIAFSHPLAGVTRSRPVTVGDPPAPPAASNSGPFCQGQDLNLYATTVPGAVYRWTGPNGFSSTAQSPVIAEATLAAAGLYSVIANVEGCESSAATTTVDALAPTPGPDVLGHAQVCFGSRLLIRAADPAFLYQWYRNGEPIPDATAAVYSVDQASFAEEADYSVSSSDVTGCTTAVSALFHVTIVFCHAEARALAVDPTGNGILDPGETATVDPTWKNRDIVTLALSGTATGFSGPPGASYVIVDPTAGYGSLDPNTSADCLTATGDCYSVMASFPGTRPATHWDAFFDETPGVDPAHTWVLHVGESFTDVPQEHPFYAAIETVLHNAVTAGCTPSAYCPAAGVTRAQMAVLLLKAKYGPQYEPPPATGNVFADVPADAFAAAWIEEMERQDITEGCGDGNYCPDQILTRAQMAVFLLRAEHSGISPCTGIFADVPCPDGFAVDYIEELYARGVTAGCNASPLLYCPSSPNTRGQMAVFLTRWFELVLYAP